MPDEEKGFLTSKQVREELSISPSTLHRLLASGDITSYRVGKGIRIRRSDLEKYLASRVTKAKADFVIKW